MADEIKSLTGGIYGEQTVDHVIELAAKKVDEFIGDLPPEYQEAASRAIGRAARKETAQLKSPNQIRYLNDTISKN